MATKTFTTMVEMENFIESACARAVEITCNRLLSKLQDLIMSEYYDAYDNRTYDRTYQFYRSAMTKMLTTTMGMIFMDANAMDYPFSGRGWSWDGATQLEQANKGIHGGWATEDSKQHHYWDAFEEYCDKNAVSILRNELEKVGIKTV